MYNITIDLQNGSQTGDCLRTLDFSYCMEITSEGLGHIRHRCKNLTTLYLTGCIHLVDIDIIDVVKTCSKLSCLGLGYCRELTDAVLIAISDCLWIETLYLNRCALITDYGVCAIASQCTGLQLLNLYSCKRITDASLTRLAECCVNLKHLDITYCPLLTLDGVQNFATIEHMGLNLKTDLRRPTTVEKGIVPPTDEKTEKEHDKVFRQLSKPRGY